MNKLISILLLYLFFSSCEKEIAWKFTKTGENKIVVDGILTNVKKSHIIKISRTVTKINDKPNPISGAVVSIYDGESAHILVEAPQNSGIYRTDTNYRAVLNKAYKLQILYRNEIYTAKERMIPVGPFNKLSYTLDKGSNLYYIDSIAKSFSSKESAMYEVIVDWSHLPEYADVPILEKRAVLRYYTIKTIDVSQVFAPDKQTIYFPLGSRIMEKKFSLTAKHAEFIRSLLAETEWRGGFFDVTQANVHTNISNGALGYFGVCTVVRDTVLVK
ncbi:MAG: hypothetical protein B6I20_05895 [Bacteroidetes bacterium 4572_117]|nr:MAG: hypothetical protein B6I20_05895 [Bacteroidetes bacterium 4572_117]